MIRFNYKRGQRTTRNSNEGGGEVQTCKQSLNMKNGEYENPEAATPVWQVWQLPYLGFYIFPKQVTQWAKSGDIGAKNKRKWPKNL